MASKAIKEEPEIKSPSRWVDYVGNSYRPDDGETRMQLVQNRVLAAIADSLNRIAGSLEKQK